MEISDLLCLHTQIANFFSSTLISGKREAFEIKEIEKRAVH